MASRWASWSGDAAGARGAAAPLLCATLLLAAGVAATARAGEEAEERFVVVRAGKVIPIEGDEITKDATIVIVNGKIRSVGSGLEYPRNARVIDARDRVVMPGLINPYSRFGLPNYPRQGVQANQAVADELYPSGDEYDELLKAGYTALGLYPAGQGIPGRGAVVKLAPQPHVVAAPAALRVTDDIRTLRQAIERAKAEIEKVEKARKEFDAKQEQQKKAQAAAPATQPASQPASAPATQPAFQPPPIDPKHQPIVDLLQKKEGLFAALEVGGASDFLHFEKLLTDDAFEHRYVAQVGIMSDLSRVAEALGEADAKIVLTPLITRVPYSAERENLPRALSAAGCIVSLTPWGDSAEEHRRIFERVSELVREGWPRAAALRALTLNPAAYLGLEKQLGSIEKGKDADLIFLDADPLAPGARVRAVMVDGELVDRLRTPGDRVTP